MRSEGGLIASSHQDPTATERRLTAVAVVLTYRRPRLATQVVRHLLDAEGFDPGRVVLVINGEGGLDDLALEGQLDVVRLPENVGPAGGYGAGFAHILRSTDATWIYVCEDDGTARKMPAPRVTGLIERIEAFERAAADESPIGAVVVDGRHVDPRTGAQSRHRSSSPAEFEPVEWGVWHGVLLSRRVLDAGVLPDASLFWGGEDCDFFLRARRAGFRVVVDLTVTRSVGEYSLRERKAALGIPSRMEEAWCTYYDIRNPLLMRREHGGLRWGLYWFGVGVRAYVKALYRRAPADHRRAMLFGLRDGLLLRAGKNPAFVREVGER